MMDKLLVRYATNLDRVSDGLRSGIDRDGIRWERNTKRMKGLGSCDRTRHDKKVGQAG